TTRACAYRTYLTDSAASTRSDPGAGVAREPPGCCPRGDPGRARSGADGAAPTHRPGGTCRLTRAARQPRRRTGTARERRSAHGDGVGRRVGADPVAPAAVARRDGRRGSVRRDGGRGSVG